MMNRESIQGEINACKSLLADTDYTILKTLEGLLSCTSATGMISYLKELTKDLSDLREKRQAWRDKVNEMEAQLAELEAQITEPNAAETAETTEVAQSEPE